MLPTIHFNGTSVKTLREGYGNACDKIEDFIAAWGDIEFHPRDYYVQGLGNWDKAVKEKQEMSKKIEEVKEYLYKIREHLYSK